MLFLLIQKPALIANVKKINHVNDQEMQGGKFLPAFFVEEVELGQTFPRGEWPSHMSYFPPVDTTFKPELADRLREYVNPMPPFVAKIGKGAKFGPEEDKPVLLVEPSKELIAVHRALVSVLQYLPHPTQYRTPFRPHISLKENGFQLETGDTIEIGDFSIVETTPYSPSWHVLAKIGLKGVDMKTDARLIKKSK